MPERKQQPTQNLFDPGAAHPACMVETEAVEHGFFHMMLYFFNNTLVGSEKHHLMLVPETTVVNVWRSYAKSFAINK